MIGSTHMHLDMGLLFEAACWFWLAIKISPSLTHTYPSNFSGCDASIEASRLGRNQICLAWPHIGMT